MIQADNRMAAAIRELVDSGAAEYLSQQVRLRTMVDGLESDSMRGDREYRARMENAKTLDREIQAIINSMVDMR